MRRGKIGRRETANAGLEPYPDYKPSGVEWLGGVPAHWEMRRLKMAAENVVRQTRGRESGEIYIALEHVESWTGKIRKADPDAGFDSQVKQFRAGDVLFGKLRPYLAKVTRPAESGACVGEFLVLRPRADNLLPGYLEQLLRSKPIIDAVDASTFGAKMPRADWQFIGNLVLPLPPPAEQAAIARYLDRVNERIHRFIAAKKRLIGLLEEKRRAVIHHAVTRGLEPDVRLKPSGVEWLGDVPAHWEVRRLKDSVCGCVNGVWGTDPNGIDDLPCVRVADFNRQKLRIRTPIPTIRAIAPKERHRRILEFGDLLIEKSGGGDQQPVGSVILFDHKIQAVCSNFVARMPVRKEFNSGYLTFLHASLYAIGLNQRSIKQTTGIQNLDLAAYLAEPIAFPPLAEQAAIAAHLDKAVAVIDAAVACTCRWIELLREYRVSLAANVVTGKLDVRQAAANLPDEADESVVPS